MSSTAGRTSLQSLPDSLLPEAEPMAGRLSLHVHDRFESVASLWPSLQADNQNSLHNDRTWCEAWHATNPLPLALIEGRIDGRSQFLLPLKISRKRGLRTARFIAGAYANLNSGLFLPDCPPIDADELELQLIEALSDRADLVSLENMALNWRGRLHPLSRVPHVENHNRAFQMPLLPSFEDTLKQVNAKRRRKKFRLQQRRLEEAGGYRLHQPQDAAETHALLDEFFRQKAIRFDKMGLPDVFREKSVQAFFHALLDVPAGADAYPLRIHALQLMQPEGPIVIAIAGVSRKGDHMICQFGSIREELVPDASPGEFLFWHIIEQACADGLALFDFGIGDQIYKRSWCTVETIQYDLLLPLTAKGRLAALGHRGKVWLKAAIKANPMLYGMIQRMRAGSTRPDQTADEE